mmetsp:Transcript_40798/g.46531  ORF Transcript_40798/g.46531 Transcript_40798/m.46531 type:complete len:111 (+) Transcript_40798:336-668(+)
MDSNGEEGSGSGIAQSTTPISFDITHHFFAFWDRTVGSHNEQQHCHSILLSTIVLYNAIQYFSREPTNESAQRTKDNMVLSLPSSSSSSLFLRLRRAPYIWIVYCIDIYQ